MMNDGGGFYLEQQIVGMIGQSRDPYYTEYLRNLLFQLRSGAVTPEYVSAELGRTWQIYQQRLLGTAYPQQPVQVQQPVQMQQPNPAQQGFVQQPMQTQQQGFAQQPIPYQQAVPVRPPVSRKNTEYTVGAVVLSVVGVLFILAAFVMLGMIYMDGMIKGMCMYGIAAIVLVISELFVAKKLPRFAVGTTALAISGLYLTTLLNYGYFRNFGGWVAVGVTVAIALLALWVSHKKDSGVIRVVSMIACYVCVLMTAGDFMELSFEKESVFGGTTDLKFIGIAASLLVINLCNACLPVKRARDGISVAHMICNSVFSILFSLFAAFGVSTDVMAYYLISVMLIQGIVFFNMTRPYLVQEGGKVREEHVVLYIVAVAILLGQFALCMSTMSIGVRLHAVEGGLLVVCAALFALFYRSSLKWLQYIYLCVAAFLLYGLGRGGDESHYWQMAVVLGIFLSAKLLSRVKVLRVWELIVTLLAAREALYFFENRDIVQGICFLAAFLLSLAAVYDWKSVYEEIVLFVCIAFVWVNFESEMRLAVAAGIILAGTLCFNSFSFFRDKDIRLINYVNLALMCGTYFFAAFCPDTLLYILMLAIGCAYFVLAFREKFRMNFKIKNLIFMLFLCYMTMIWDIPVPVYRSIILMAIAIGAVIAGFAMREKRLRIAGLVLTLLVCIKIALYDFIGVATTEKMILFLVVGVIALAISGIYIALEKKIV